MPTHKRYTRRLNIYVTAELHRKLEQIRDQQGAQATVPDVVRAAIRLYVDDQEQIIGSRRHFQKTLRDEIAVATEALKKEMMTIHLQHLWAEIFILTALTGGLSPIVGRVTGKPVTSSALLADAAAHIKAQWPLILRTLNETRNSTHQTEFNFLKEVPMNHTQRIHAVARQVRGLTRDLAREAVERYLESLVDEAARGEWVSLPGLGRLRIVVRPSGGQLQSFGREGRPGLRQPGVRLQTCVRLAEPFKARCHKPGLARNQPGEGPASPETARNPPDLE